MPCYKDEKTNTWYCKFYYTDLNGSKKQKLKRGFKLQREAKDWERNFLETRALDVNVKFKNFLEQYYKDAESRLRQSTLANKKTLINLKILPYFQDMTLSEIKPVHVRQWQNTLLSYTDVDGGRQVVEVMAEAIQADGERLDGADKGKSPVELAWGVTVKDGKLTQ